MSLDEIVEEAGCVGGDGKVIPSLFLRKIFKSLTEAGILKSHRGMRGGFSLARQLEEIPAAEILRCCKAANPPKTGNKSTWMSKTSASIRKDFESSFSGKTAADYISV